MNKLLQIVLFLFVASLMFVSCSDDDQFDETSIVADGATGLDEVAIQIENSTDNKTTNTKRDDRPIGVGPGGDGTFGHLGYYTYYPCNPNRFTSVFEDVFEEFFKDYEQCICFTEQWISENCNSDYTAVGFRICDRRVRPEVPFGAFCGEG